MSGRALVLAYPGGLLKSFGMDCNVKLLHLWPGERMSEFLAAESSWRYVRWNGEEQRSTPPWKIDDEEERAKRRLLVQWGRIEQVVGRKVSLEELEWILRHALALGTSGAELCHYIRQEARKELEKEAAAQSQDAHAAPNTDQTAAPTRRSTGGAT